MREAIFLSASVPTGREPEHLETADTVAIAAAVSALVYVVLGRRPLVWGGHPAITPMIWAVAEELKIDYGAWVRLYQSDYFEDDFPEDNQRFSNMTITRGVRGDRDGSLLEMRTRMFEEHSFSAAVFIGGMKGVLDELTLFQNKQKSASLLPIATTGGASLVVARNVGADDELWEDLDYIPLFHRRLGISYGEERRPRPIPRYLSD